MLTLAQREARARRQCAASGYRLTKRDGLFNVIDPVTGGAMLAHDALGHPCAHSLDDLEEWLSA